MSERVREYLKDVYGVVEATRFEQHSLWCDHAIQGAAFGPERTKRWSWAERLEGLGEHVGDIAARPVWVSLVTAVVADRCVLFWHVTSAVADFTMCERWLKSVLPQTAFKSEGCVRGTDPMNFVNLLHEFEEMT